MFQALRNYNFRIFWFAQVISMTGTWMQMTAMPWLVLQVSNSPAMLGLVTMVQFLPILLFTLVGGVVADRVPRRQFLICTQIVAATQSLTIGTLAFTGRVQIWQIFALAALGGLNAAFDNPTRQAFLSEMVERTELGNAVALNSGLFNAARIVGPMLAGFVIGPSPTLHRMAVAFFLNSFSFFPSIGALLLMKKELLLRLQRANAGKGIQQVLEGLRFCVGQPSTLMIVVIMAVTGTFGYNFVITLALLGQSFHQGAQGQGIFSACMGVGSVAGATYLARRGIFNRQLMLIGASGFSLFLLGVSFSPTLALCGVMLVAVGFFSSFINTVGGTLLQVEAPDPIRGRVMSIVFLLFAGSTPIGAPITGALVHHYRIRPTLGIEACICALGAFWGICYYVNHNIRAGDDARAASAPTVARGNRPPAEEPCPARIHGTLLPDHAQGTTLETATVEILEPPAP